jgi:hypothetical protein
MNIEVKLNYDLTPVESKIAGVWDSCIRICLEFQTAKRIFKPELRYTLSKSEDFKKAMAVIATDALNAMLPEIMAEANKCTWRRTYHYEDDVWYDTNGGRKLYVYLSLNNQPTGNPWTVQDVEKFLWR